MIFLNVAIKIWTCGSWPNFYKPWLEKKSNAGSGASLKFKFRSWNSKNGIFDWSNNLLVSAIFWTVARIVILRLKIGMLRQGWLYSIEYSPETIYFAPAWHFITIFLSAGPITTPRSIKTSSLVVAPVQGSLNFFFCIEFIVTANFYWFLTNPIALPQKKSKVSLGKIKIVPAGKYFRFVGNYIIIGYGKLLGLMEYRLQ